jgi:hypothetical protein
VIVCDPPLTTVFTGSCESHEQSVEPNQAYDDGYEDFMNYIDQENHKLYVQPPRTSLFDDVVHYIDRCPSLLSQPYGLDCNEHEKIVECMQNNSKRHCMGYNRSLLAHSFILKKIISAHYTQVYDFLIHQVSSMGSRGWSIGKKDMRSVDEFEHVKQDWLRFRSAPIRRNLDLLFDAFAIPISSSGRSRGWTDWQWDFHWLREKYHACSEEYQGLTGAIAALSNLITSAKAVKESAKNAKAAERTEEIQSYAFVLVPLSLITSIFAMTADYAPGGTKFWIYWAVSIPITLLLMAFVALRDRKLFTSKEILSGFGSKTSKTLETESPEL